MEHLKPTTLMEPYPDSGEIAPKPRQQSQTQPKQASRGEAGTPETRLTQLGSGADIARDAFGGLDAKRLHDLTEGYRERHGDAAWEHIVNTLPKWRADPQLITGFHGEQAIELLPSVLNDAERFEIARAVWKEQYAGVHEYINLGNIELTDHLESIVRRRIAAAISKPAEESGVREQIHTTLLWLCAGNRETKEGFIKRLKVAEFGQAIRPIRDGVREMRAKIAARADGWSGRVERRIRSGANTFDIELHKTEPVKITWHMNRETARALHIDTGEPTAPRSGKAETDASPPLASGPAATGAPGRKKQRTGWLKRLAEQLMLRKGDDRRKGRITRR